MYTMDQVQNYYDQPIGKKKDCQFFVVGDDVTDDVKIFVDEAHELKTKSRKFLKHLKNKMTRKPSRFGLRTGKVFTVFATATPNKELEEVLFAQVENKEELYKNFFYKIATPLLKNIWPSRSASVKQLHWRSYQRLK